MKKLALCCLAACLAAFADASAARASIVCVAPTATTTGSFTITAPIVFNITAAGTFAEVLLVGWVNFDGGQTKSSLSPNLAFTLNTNALSAGANLFDSSLDTSHGETTNDGYLYLQSTFPAVVVGDTVTLKTGSYTLGAVSGFNPQATQTFNGNLFLVGSNGTRLSNAVAAGVPEPSTWAILGLSVVCLGIATLRRRLVVRT